MHVGIPPIFNARIYPLSLLAGSILVHKAERHTVGAIAPSRFGSSIVISRLFIMDTRKF
jgi:hypothetical protein